MQDDTSVKGYELAKDFTKKIIARAIKDAKDVKINTDWQLKTQFGGFWEKGGGPSASLAITLSMISVLADEPVYRNRFVTGTIDPIQGEVGAIGGVYYKGLMPMRLSEISRERGENEEMYFLFPAMNLKQLRHELIFDPFEVEKKIIAIPISTFDQAYHLMTCGHTMKSDDWINSGKYGKEKLEETILRIQKRFL
jgi:predicted ATP-dependent protease